MLDDFTLIHADYKDWEDLTIYPLGDVHIGSKQFNLEAFKEWLEEVKNDEHGVVVIVGDMMNVGLKNSKTNVYQERLSPQEQKDLCYELLKPIANKIIGGCSGNHEDRMTKEVGSNPLYDVFCRLQIEDKYRENVGFIKLTVGKKGRNPNVYGVTFSHGGSRNKEQIWDYSIDGADVFISGHTHTMIHDTPAKIKLDLIHNSIKIEPFHEVVVRPFQNYGGYAIKGKYKPSCYNQFQKISFSGTTKKISYHYE